jgi:hypothetical protein
MIGKPDLLIRLALLASCLLALPPVAAAEVFRWTDENGRVHYGQRPPPTGAERLDLPQPAAGAAGIDADAAQRRERRRRLLDAYDYEREQKKAQQARETDDRQQAAVRCRKLQQRWRRLNYPRPLYVTGKDGEREYLSDQQREAEKARMRPAYREACGREP